MTERTASRRLVAIFYADVAGYSRLTGADEEGSHARIMALLDDATARITESGGSVLRYAGDAILAVFPSVVLAVDTAAAIQVAGAERNAGLAADARIDLRIGINLGDVIEDRGEVYGEGVNLAARLEAAAEPGGLCISDIAHGQVAGKASVTFADGGEETFKNIARPVRVWRWSPGASGATVPPGKAAPSEKPSVAVLPFDNMSGDPEQAYFSDGITEDIITALSRFHALLVIGRNSSFAFRGQSVDLKEIGRRLGAAYVVEGSVRKAGNRVRVTAQLIDTESGGHVWADRFDRDLDDVFAIQDEIVEQVVWKVTRQLEEAELARARRKHTTTEAYDLYLLAAQHVRAYSLDDAVLAVDLLQQAIARDPRFSPAHTMLAVAYLNQGASAASREIYERGVASARAALALNESDETAHAVLGHLLNLLHRRSDAGRHIDRAVGLNPNGLDVVPMKAYDLVWSNRLEKARTWIARASRLDPIKPGWLFEIEGVIGLLLGHFDEAAECFRRIPPSFYYHHGYLAAALAESGRMDEAASHVAEAQRLFPGITCEALPSAPWEPAVRAKLVDSLRKAGLPG